MKKTILAITIITFVSLVISAPLMIPGFYLVHDDQQIARVYLFDKALKSGQIPPRWVDQLGFGFGYPLFVFYPPFVYFLGEIFHLSGFNFIDSVKLVFFSSIIASGLAMFLMVKDLWGRFPGLVSAIFYMLLPYRAIDIYIRGAMAEAFSFVWLPPVLWSFLKLTRTQKPLYLYLSAIFLALLMITHNLIFLPFMLILPLYLMFLISISQDKKLSIINCLLTIAFAFGLSAFFWIPSLLEKKFTIVDQLLLLNLASYNIHFVYPQQLWNWAWGFGGSAAGLADGLSFKIGKLHILASFASIVLATIYLLTKNKKTGSFNQNLAITSVFFLLFILSALMTTFYSKFIWDLIPPLAYLQFPWRFLIFTGLTSSVLAGALIFLLKVPTIKLLASFIIISLLIATNLKLFKPQTYREGLTDELATASEVINWQVSSSSFEYIPYGVELYKGPLGTNQVKIAKGDIPTNKVEIISGVGQIDLVSTSPSKVEFRLDAQSQTQIKTNTFNFPGWRVLINDNVIPIDDNNRLKLITFTAPKGTHHIKVEFKNTPVRTIANGISLLTITLLILLALRKWKKLTY